MIKFKESELFSIYRNALENNGIKLNSPEEAEMAFTYNFFAQAKYLKDVLSSDKTKAVLRTDFTVEGQTLFAILSKIVHGEVDSTIPDSYELMFSFYEPDIKDNDIVVTTNDPEFYNTLNQIILSKSNYTVSSSTNFIHISFTPLESIIKFINKMVNEGKELEVELEDVFSLIITHTEEGAKSVLLPGALVKTIIKSDDVVALDEEK